jgi:DNA repair protein RadC
VQAGEILGIDVLDHLIIGADDFLSLQERRLL